MTAVRPVVPAWPARAPRGGASGRDSTPPAVSLAEVRSRVAAGAPPGDVRALPRRVRHAVAVAEQVGAPLLPALDASAEALEDDRRAQQALRVATAQARAVAGGLLALPALLVPGLGRLLGLDLIGFYTTPTGAVIVVIAAALVIVGAVSVAVLVRRASRPRPAGAGRAPMGLLVGAVVTLLAGVLPGLVAGVVAVSVVRRRGAGRGEAGRDGAGDDVVDLVATALAGGLGPAAALRVVADLGVGPCVELRRLALAHDLGRPLASEALAPLAAVLGASRTWGAPAVPTLRALARDLRAEALAVALAAAERLPAQLTFPAALCLLPASVLLIGAPLVADGLAAATGAG